MKSRSQGVEIQIYKKHIDMINRERASALLNGSLISPENSQFLLNFKQYLSQVR